MKDGHDKTHKSVLEPLFPNIVSEKSVNGFVQYFDSIDSPLIYDPLLSFKRRLVIQLFDES